MHTVHVWWGSITVFSQIFWGFSIFGTVLLLMQLASMFLGIEGIGGHDTDATVESHDGGHSQENHSFMAGLKLFTLRGIVAFICMFGWSGLVMIEYGAGKILTCVLSTIVGSFSMLLVAILMKIIYSMQTSGNIDEQSFVGKKAMVYIPIPEKDKGFGKINLNMDGKLEERIAVSAGPGISVGTLVKVISYSNIIFTVERV